MLGNTLDRNEAVTGGFSFSNAPVEVTNNIVVNSIGTGIACSGTPPAQLDHNLVWGSSTGDYSGCSPGPGSLGADPLFADTTQADYHLALHSPAIDAGRTDPGYADPDGSRGDLGRYGSHSFVMDQPSYPQNLSAGREMGNAVLRWGRNPEGDVAFYAVYCDTTSGFRPSAANLIASVAAPDTTAHLGPGPGTAAYYTLCAVDGSGYASGFAAEAMLGPPTDAGPPAPHRFQLHPNVPNPFNPATTIRFEQDRAGPVVLEIFDLSGRLVRTLVRAAREPGLHAATWDGTDAQGRRVASGVYVVRLQSGERTLSRKIVALK